MISNNAAPEIRPATSPSFLPISSLDLPKKLINPSAIFPPTLVAAPFTLFSK
jgi:hypothetical protein